MLKKILYVLLSLVVIYFVTVWFVNKDKLIINPNECYLNINTVEASKFIIDHIEEDLENNIKNNDYRFFLIEGYYAPSLNISKHKLYLVKYGVKLICTSHYDFYEMTSKRKKELEVVNKYLHKYNDSLLKHIQSKEELK